ncbi:uncharacterized protein Z520_09780 [Fonsecaea multimorphosa CBS 102226]|uniref:Extracellular membrane protein CFEM domain-containing protein n=1 Tax=Fonsecaea multimorphosa CBS 102226 TaxID=1442371 RepID=A0A0D2JV43_9EURO|nr:uncharacterized protein Z520_09780 [Fonsecaea multimorphosa CBS 102226]KIX94394.1 hypothetical protein Z520_09780 [Fonsecaea multimorphosa CBS 102226]OAL20154.1 hypothetical protein AYO22_09126 [Fonsecaea multimorphosa]
MKTSLLLQFVALAVRVVLADIPPACLLSAVNTQDQPGNLSSICGNEATDVQKAIASMCSGNAVSVAQSAFISTCSVAGSSVAPYTASSSSNKTSHTSTAAGTFVYTTAVYNSDCSCTTTIVTSATTGAAVSTGLASATPTGGSSGASGSNSAGGTSATGNAAADNKQVGSFVAAVIAIAGVVAVL